jgi:hypothetical protein
MAKGGQRNQDPAAKAATPADSVQSAQPTDGQLSEEQLHEVSGGTTNLMDACCKGKHVPTVTIAV